MTLFKRIAEIEARRNAATPGPWECQIPAMTGEWPAGRVKGLKIAGRLYGSPLFPIDDAQFIASAPQDIDFLLIALKRAITVADDACDKECNPKTCSPCKLLADLERFASKGNSCE